MFPPRQVAQTCARAKSHPRACALDAGVSVLWGAASVSGHPKNISWPRWPFPFQGIKNAHRRL